METLKPTQTNIWLEELNDILRGASGGFLFGVPLLYTVELWSIGSSTQPPRLLGALGIAFVAVYLLTQIEGFRRDRHLHPVEAVMESIEVLALGLVCAAIALVLLRRITLSTPLTEALGKLVFEGIPFSIGVALARSILDRDRGRGKHPQSKTAPQQSPRANRINIGATLADVDATLIGALIISINIAPTDEISLLAESIPPLWLLPIVAASLALSYIIVFVAGFAKQTERQQQRGLFQQPLSETLVAYLVSLLAAIFMLWFFRQLSSQNPWQEWLSDTIVLGLPAAIGGAAGRIAI